MPVSLHDLIARLAEAFPREKVTSQRLELLVSELADLQAEAVAAAVTETIRKSEFFPTIAALRKAAAEFMLGLPSEPAALAQVEARLAWARKPEAERGEPPEVHPLVREALDQVGGWHAFRAVEEATIVRGQFLRLFRELRATTIHEVQVGRIELGSGELRGELSS